MSISNKLRAVVAISVLGTSFGASACFDVSQIEVSTPPPLWLDDFEDGDQVPQSDQFLPWHCYAFQSDAAQPSCPWVAPGFHSKGAGTLTFELNVPLDPAQVSSVGAGLGLFSASPVPVDLSAWHTLRFDAKFQPSSASSTGHDTLAVRLKCPGAGAPGSALDSSLHFAEKHFELGGDWESFTTPLTTFEGPPFIATAVHVPDCLRLVRALVFEISLEDDRSGVMDGEPGTLTLDNVRLE